MDNNIDEDTFELINKYLSNTLNDHEKTIVQQKINTDPKFEQSIEWVKQNSSSLTKVVANQSKTMAKEWLAQDRNQHQKFYDKKGKSKWLLLGALGLITAALLLYFLVLKSPKTDPIQYAETLLEQPYKNPMILRNSSDNDWSSLISLYKNKRYPEFIIRLKPRINDNSATSEQVLYYAISHLYLEPIDCASAIPQLNNLINKSDGYEEQALWFRSLANLKCNNEQAAKADLKKVISNGSFMVKEAKQLLTNIK